jgi:hypothetical protein
MPLIVAAIIGALAEVAASLVGRVLLGLFMSYVTYEGIDILLSHVMNAIQADFSGLPADAIGMCGLLKIDVDISIALSAIATRVLLSGLQSGAVTKLRIKK